MQSEGNSTEEVTGETEKSNNGTDKSKRLEDVHAEPPETYPDILDIAGMDYSSATRKSPIHN